MNYYLIGIKEANRYKKNQKFKKYLDNTIKEFGIDVIAEDTNREILRKKKIKASDIKEICSKNKVKYIPCDPLNKEKKLIGYNKNVIGKYEELVNNIVEKESLEQDCGPEKEKIKPFLSIKELVWHRVLKNKLENKKINNVLIVCNSWHLKMNTLPSLLKNRGNLVNVIESEWEAEKNSFLSFFKKDK